MMTVESRWVVDSVSAAEVVVVAWCCGGFVDDGRGGDVLLVLVAFASCTHVQRWIEGVE